MSAHVPVARNWFVALIDFVMHVGSFGGHFRYPFGSKCFPFTSLLIFHKEHRAPAAWFCQYLVSKWLPPTASVRRCRRLPPRYDGTQNRPSGAKGARTHKQRLRHFLGSWTRRFSRVDSDWIMNGSTINLMLTWGWCFVIWIEIVMDLFLLLGDTLFGRVFMAPPWGLSTPRSPKYFYFF